MIGASILPLCNSQWIFAGLDSSFKALSCANLAAAEHHKFIVYFAFPDGHAANHLVTFNIASSVPKIIVIKFICTGHCLSISHNISIDAVDIVDSEYSLAATLSNASHQRRIRSGFDGMVQHMDTLDVYLEGLYGEA